MQDSEQIVHAEVESQAQATAPELTWPTTQQFMEEATRDEAVSIAAVEILEIQAGLIRAMFRLQKSPIPVGIKMIFEKKIRSAVSQLYSAIPLQVQPQVEYVVMVEQAGGPEKLAEMQRQLDEAEAQAKQTAENVVELPKVPEQWPAEMVNGELRLVPQPEKPLATVLQFKPKSVAPTGPQDEPPNGGTPIAVAA